MLLLLLLLQFWCRCCQTMAHPIEAKIPSLGSWQLPTHTRPHGHMLHVI
jgi:hypothetical protein